MCSSLDWCNPVFIYLNLISEWQSVQKQLRYWRPDHSRVLATASGSRVASLAYSLGRREASLHHLTAHICISSHPSVGAKKKNETKNRKKHRACIWSLRTMASCPSGSTVAHLANRQMQPLNEGFLKEDESRQSSGVGGGSFLWWATKHSIRWSPASRNTAVRTSSKGQRLRFILRLELLRALQCVNLKSKTKWAGLKSVFITSWRGKTRCSGGWLLGEKEMTTRRHISPIIKGKEEGDIREWWQCDASNSGGLEWLHAERINQSGRFSADSLTLLNKGGCQSPR